MSLTDKEIGKLSKGFSERTTADRSVIVGLIQTDFLEEKVHWVKDSHRIIMETTLEEIEKFTLKENIDAEMVWMAIRNHNANVSDSLRKSPDPGNMKKKKEWTTW